VGAGPLWGLSLQLLLLGAAFAFLAFSWTRGGMTLGMQAWRLRVQTLDGRSITPVQALVRFLVGLLSLAAFGLGYLWILVDRERRSWGDIVSGYPGGGAAETRQVGGAPRGRLTRIRHWSLPACRGLCESFTLTLSAAAR
jgi:uncharacterized RDD family membrane protein YckC